METPKPQRDPEFYDEHGRVKDPEIAHTMAHVENYFYEDKKSDLKRASEKGIFAKPLEEMKVEKEFNKRRLKLDEWMETAPEQIRDREQLIKKSQKEREEELKLLRSAPSLLSPEEEAKLWERLDKLNNVQISDRLRESFKTGIGWNDGINEENCSFVDLVTFLEGFDRIFSASDRFGIISFSFQVRHLNGKSSEPVMCEYENSSTKLKKLVVAIPTMR